MKTKTEVKERPILFSGPMVRAILDGRKTQTRRAMKNSKRHSSGTENDGFGGFKLNECPYGKPGDRLWVREAWGVAAIYDQTRPSGICQDIRRDPNWPLNKAPCGVRYPANMDCVGVRIRPSIHMPRWASRITLEITDVRVERLNDISEEDAKAEGFGLGAILKSERFGRYMSAGQFGFASLWESINGEGSWAANPYVWVIEFEKVGE